MRWSQLKKRVELLFASSVSGRVGLHTTRYHKAPDQMGRAWITLDGREVINMCSFVAESAVWREATRLRAASGCTDYRNPDHWGGYHRAYAEAGVILRDNAVFSRPDFHSSLFAYLNVPFEGILTSADPIIRAMGMLDRRLGLRRLATMDVLHEHPLVRTLYQFRSEAERTCAVGDT